MSEIGNNSLFDRESTLELLEITSDIPTLPERFFNIQAVIQDPEAGADELAAIIREDQATSAMVLKFANSPAYHPSHSRIADLHQAIARLGLRETANIASAMSLMYGLNMPTGMSNIRIFWAHAFAVALVCEHLACAIDPNRRDIHPQTAYMTGLLHDIGRAVLGMRIDLDYFARETGRLQGQALIAAETAYYGVDHAEAGMLMLRRWRFPGELSLAVGEHHAQTPQRLLGRICQLADRYAHQSIPENTLFESIPALVKQTLTEQPPDNGTLR